MYSRIAMFRNGARHPYPSLAPLCTTSENTSSHAISGEDLIGARAYRVVFAGISLPLAVAAVVYFINHRYSGTPLWDLRGVPGVHATVWVVSLISFFFLYPSTFNLLEVCLSIKVAQTRTGLFCDVGMTVGMTGRSQTPQLSGTITPN